MRLRISGAALFGILSVSVLAGCSDNSGGTASEPYEPSAKAIEQAEIVTPRDERLAEIYDRSCRSCHAYVDSGAPLAGHAREWRRRLTAAGGIEPLVQRVKTGIGGMPAMGLCMDCTDEDFNDLIVFMAIPGPLSAD